MEFGVLGTVEERPNSILLRARRADDGTAVLLKVLGEQASARDLERLQHEHEIGKTLDHERDIAAYERRRPA